MKLDQVKPFAKSMNVIARMKNYQLSFDMTVTRWWKIFKVALLNLQTSCYSCRTKRMSSCIEGGWFPIGYIV